MLAAHLTADKGAATPSLWMPKLVMTVRVGARGVGEVAMAVF